MEYVLNALTVTLGIIFAAVPFLALGVALSASITLFVPKDFLAKLYGKGFFRNYGVSAIAGFMFPVCECGIVPVAKSLLKSGVPLSGVVMFLTSAPILNPITIAATAAAFPASPEIWAFRIIISQIVTLLMGWAFSAYSANWASKPLSFLPLSGGTDCSLCGDGECTGHSAPKNKFFRWIDAFYGEFANVFFFVLMGAALTSVMQIIVPRELIASLGAMPFASIAAFMFLALALSVCSSVDAFVILPFAGTASAGALLGFLNYGPLLDVKNVLLFKAYFSREFYLRYFVLVTALVFLLSATASLVIPLLK